jgi:hypothetical protein
MAPVTASGRLSGKLTYLDSARRLFNLESVLLDDR